ncbi:HEPN domain-containing protein [Thermococcus sp. Bubb.Bath]|uniref:HEPN domain-containing protein n=1 Tax=Thermococcus sp. Bubb.Bath TaxID=1638242 RepID=UPI00143AB7AA|nr:HEPN domain-containing protein [Thermococcus sp. Bubb.Bath]NJF26084.1 HEPN domain-containing protein [Thermococcus sp. Bubb.Bath]
MMEEILRELEVAEEELSSAFILFDYGKYRDTISRAYYAVFHAARAFLLIKGLSPRKHSGVVSLFGKEAVLKGTVEDEYGKILTKAFQMRTLADYNVLYAPSREEAEAVPEDAERFVEKLREVIEHESKKGGG